MLSADYVVELYNKHILRPLPCLVNNFFVFFQPGSVVKRVILRKQFQKERHKHFA